MARLPSLILLLALTGSACPASQRLLYLEAQAVGGYSFEDDEVRWYSMHQMDVMQKPSIGFDLLQRLSSRTGDWGALAVQARLAYDETRASNVEPQLYNAYLKLKPGFGDIWIGHNKPAFGLAMAMDNHGTLLQPMSYRDYSLDRDWGAGFYRDFNWGNAAFSATTGSGMPLVLKGNRLFSARLSAGDLNGRNWSVGFSASYGKVLSAMGYHLDAQTPPRENRLLGTDATLAWDRFETRLELVNQRLFYGQGQGRTDDWYYMSRLTVNLLSENRLKLEAQLQGVRWRHTGPGLGLLAFETATNNNLDKPTLGLSYFLTGDLAFRCSATYLSSSIFQLYWYHKI